MKTLETIASGILGIFIFIWYLLGFAVMKTGWQIFFGIIFPVYPFYVVVEHFAKLYLNIG